MSLRQLLIFEPGLIEFIATIKEHRIKGDINLTITSETGEIKHRTVHSRILSLSPIFKQLLTVDKTINIIADNSIFDIILTLLYNCTFPPSFRETAVTIIAVIRMLYRLELPIRTDKLIAYITIVSLNTSNYELLHIFKILPEDIPASSVDQCLNDLLFTVVVAEPDDFYTLVTRILHLGFTAERLLLLINTVTIPKTVKVHILLLARQLPAYNKLSLTHLSPLTTDDLLGLGVLYPGAMTGEYAKILNYLVYLKNITTEDCQFLLSDIYPTSIVTELLSN